MFWITKSTVAVSESVVYDVILAMIIVQNPSKGR